MLKCWQQFNDKVRHLKAHMELIDASLSLAYEECTYSSQEARIKDILKEPSYMKLDVPNTTKERNRVVAFSRARLHQRVVVDLYGYFTEFLSNAVREIIAVSPRQFLSNLNSQNQRALKFEEIIRLGNYTAIMDEFAKRIYRGLEQEQSTVILIRKFSKACNLTIPKETLDQALLYLEIRHLIIHNSNKVDEKFKKLEGADKIALDSKGRIKMTYSLSKPAIYSIFKLALHIKEELNNRMCK